MPADIKVASADVKGPEARPWASSTELPLRGRRDSIQSGYAHGLALNTEGRRRKKGTLEGDKLAFPLKR